MATSSSVGATGAYTNRPLRDCMRYTVMRMGTCTYKMPCFCSKVHISPGMTSRIIVTLRSKGAMGSAGHRSHLDSDGVAFGVRHQSAFSSASASGASAPKPNAAAWVAAEASRMRPSAGPPSDGVSREGEAAAAVGEAAGRLPRPTRNTKEEAEWTADKAAKVATPATAASNTTARIPMRRTLLRPSASIAEAAQRPPPPPPRPRATTPTAAPTAAARRAEG
mmetsp:Transcript_105417/g.283431  ORF Transcript_105417/g.283431 Transcript_105417/m.283431 type:complete len:222 (-) Transcript_105417:103-768(-)